MIIFEAPFDTGCNGARVLNKIVQTYQGRLLLISLLHAMSANCLQNKPWQPQCNSNKTEMRKTNKISVRLHSRHAKQTSQIKP